MVDISENPSVTPYQNLIRRFLRLRRSFQRVTFVAGFLPLGVPVERLEPRSSIRFLQRYGDSEGVRQFRLHRTSRSRLFGPHYCDLVRSVPPSKMASVVDNSCNITLRLRANNSAQAFKSSWLIRGSNHLTISFWS